MTVGQKVRHVSGAFLFEGKIIGDVTSSKGMRLFAVEQDHTGFVWLFGAHALVPLAESGLESVWNTTPLTPPPPPPPPLPYTFFLPVKPVPGQASKASAFRTAARQYLPVVSSASLINGNVRAEIEFHFQGEPVGDLDNLIKPILDILKGAVLKDDSQVKAIEASYVTPSVKTGVLIRLTKYEKRSHEEGKQGA